MLNDDNYKPSIGFNNFVDTYGDEIKQVYETLSKQELKNDEISCKIKKTYKNRYFIQKNKE